MEASLLLPPIFSQQPDEGQLVGGRPPVPAPSLAWPLDDLLGRLLEAKERGWLPLPCPRLLELLASWFALFLRTRRRPDELSEPEARLRTVANQRLKSGRRVASEPAVMPAPHSMPDQMAIVAAFPG